MSRLTFHPKSANLPTVSPQPSLPDWFVTDVLHATTPVIAVFGSSGSPQSIRTHFQILDLQRQHPELKFVYIDEGKEPALYQSYAKDSTTPLFIRFENSQKIAEASGTGALDRVLHPNKVIVRSAEDHTLFDLPKDQYHPPVSSEFASEVNSFLVQAGIDPKEVHVEVDNKGYTVLQKGEPPVQSNQLQVIASQLNQIVGARFPQRGIHEFMSANRFWGEKAFWIDIDGVHSNGKTPETEYLLLTSRLNAGAWIFNYKDPDFQQKVSREADRIIRQFNRMLALPDEFLERAKGDVTADPRMPLRERLVSYRDALLKLKKQMPAGIAQLHARVAFADEDLPKEEIDTLRLIYRLSYRYQNLGVMSEAAPSPEAFAQGMNLAVKEKKEDQLIHAGSVVLHHPASFRLAYSADKGEADDVHWNLQLLSDWFRFMVQKGFEVGLVEEQIQLKFKDNVIARFFIRENQIIEQWPTTADEDWKEAVVGDVTKAQTDIVQSDKDPYAFVKFRLPNGTALPPMRILSIIPDGKKRGNGPNEVERQANANIADWMSHLVVNLYDWKERVRKTGGGEEDKKSKKAQNFSTVNPNDETAGSDVMLGQMEQTTLDWIKSLTMSGTWGKSEVSVLMTSPANLKFGLKTLIKREPTARELERILYTDMGVSVAGRWATLDTKEGVKNILWVRMPDVIPHETGHDFFKDRSIEGLIDNQWHSVSLLFPREEDFLGYYLLVQDYFEDNRALQGGPGSGRIVHDDGSYTSLGAGNLGAIITSIHGGMNLIFPSAYSLWGDIAPFQGRVNLQGNEYAAELWEEEMNKSTLTGVVYHANDPHEVSPIFRHLSRFHQGVLNLATKLPPSDPMEADPLKEDSVPLDELRSYQTRTEILRPEDPRQSRILRLRAIAHYAPKILQEGLKSVKAVHLTPPQMIGVLESKEGETIPQGYIDVSGYLMTSAQERLLRAGDYKNHYRGIDLTEGVVAMHPENDGVQGENANASFHRGEQVANSDWVGSDEVPESSVKKAEPQVEAETPLEIVDNRPEQPKEWFPFQGERKEIWLEKPKAPPAPEPVESPAVPVVSEIAPIAPLSEPQQPASSPSPWVYLLAPLAPLYPVYAMLNKDKEKNAAGAVALEENQQFKTMEASALVCLDLDRAQGESFLMDPKVYQSVNPLLMEYELMYRVDPQEGFQFLKRAYDEGLNGDYIVGCLMFPLGAVFVENGDFAAALELYEWGMKLSKAPAEAKTLHDEILKVAEAILQQNRFDLKEVGWHALRLAGENVSLRTPEHVALAVDYLFWSQRSELKPEALYSVLPAITRDERKNAADQGFQWALDSDPNIQLTALKNSFAWHHNTHEFSWKLLKLLREGQVDSPLIQRFFAQIQSKEAEKIISEWLQESLSKDEFELCVGWLEKHSLNLKITTQVQVLISGLSFLEEDPTLKQRLRRLVAGHKENVVSYLTSVSWSEDPSETALLQGKALVRYFPEEAQGYRILIEGFVSGQTPAEENLLSLFGVDSLIEIPNIKQRYSEWVYDAMVRFPHAKRITELTRVLYDEMSTLIGTVQYFQLIDYLGLSFSEDMKDKGRKRKRAVEKFSKEDYFILILRGIDAIKHMYLDSSKSITDLSDAIDPWTRLALVANSLHGSWRDRDPLENLEKLDLAMQQNLSQMMKATITDHHHCMDAKVKAVLILLKLNPNDWDVEQGVVKIFRDSEWSQEQFIQQSAFLKLSRTELEWMLQEPK